MAFGKWAVGLGERAVAIANRAVANGRVGWVLARPIFAPEETKPKKLTFATVLSFAKRPMFIAFLIFV